MIDKIQAISFFSDFISIDYIARNYYSRYYSQIRIRSPKVVIPGYYNDEKIQVDILQTPCPVCLDGLLYIVFTKDFVFNCNYKEIDENFLLMCENCEDNLKKGDKETIHNFLFNLGEDPKEEIHLGVEIP